MPDMPDTSFLLHGRGVDVPDPLALAGKGISLANLMQQVQAGQLELQTKQQMAALYSNPDLLRALMGGGQGGGLGPTAPGASPDGASGGMTPELATLIGQNPLAAPAYFKQSLDFQKTQAETGEQRARAANYYQEVLDKRLQKVADAAQNVKQDPTPGNIQALAVAHAFSGAGQNAFGEMPTTMDPQGWSQFAGNVYNVLTDPKVRAETAKTIQDTQLAPQKLAVDQGNLALSQAKFYGGEAFQDPDSKAWYVRIPHDGPNGRTWAIMPASGGMPTAGTAPPAAGQSQSAGVAPPVPSAAPSGPLPRGWQPGQPLPPDAPPGSTIKTTAEGIPYMAPPGGAAPTVPTDAQGAPVTGPNFKQKDEYKSTAAEMENLNAKSQAAAQTKGMITDLVNAEAKGIYSGGITGTDFFRKLANVAAASGALTPEQTQKLANTQSWNAETGNLVAQAVSQFAGSRIAAREITFFQTVKPEALQTPQGRQQIYEALYKLADRVQQQPQQAQAYLDAGHTNLSGFQPTFKEAKLPPAKLDTLPPAKGWTGGALLGDDGHVYRAIGGKWQDTGPQQNLVSQVPQ